MIFRGVKAFEPRYLIIFLIVLTTIGIAAAGYVAQAIQYDHLFSLYEQQNSQLRANGIKPTTPSPNQVATAGAAGAAGADGAVGPRGAQGIPGADGMNGILGADGAAGSTGAAGTNGAPGTTGTPGSAGVDGAVGATGPTGATGLTGATGPAGSIPANLTIIGVTGTIYVCTPTTPTVPTYTCVIQPTPAIR